jgi:hypothetical protein
LFSSLMLRFGVRVLGTALIITPEPTRSARKFGGDQKSLQSVPAGLAR